MMKEEWEKETEAEKQRRQAKEQKMKTSRNSWFTREEMTSLNQERITAKKWRKTWRTFQDLHRS
jgi:transglutaminase/protease-like cytokinesis protein 3